MSRNKPLAIIVMILLIQMLFPGSANVNAADLSSLSTTFDGTLFKLSGYIKPSFNCENNNYRTGFLIEINGDSFSDKTDDNGYFEIFDIPEYSSGYTVKISKESYLTREIY
jgi:hypothetical protein